MPGGELMEVEVTVILDLPEINVDLVPELPSPVRLNRNSSIMTMALFLGATQKETPGRTCSAPAGEKE